MSRGLVQQSHLQSIAEAIRHKNGTSTLYKPGEMAAAVRAIPTGSGANVYAFLCVRYRCGDTVVCTNGTTSFSSNTSGYYVFPLPTGGTWNVTDGQVTREIYVSVYGQTISCSFCASLPASVPSNILLELDVKDFNETDLKWGNLSLTGSGFSLEDGAVRMPVHSYASFDLGRANTSVTVYAYIKQYTNSSGDLSILAVPDSDASKRNPNFYSRSGSLSISVYSDDTPTGLSATTWHILTMAIDADGKIVRFYVDGMMYGTKSFSASGAVVYITASISGARQINGDVKFIGVVNGAESHKTILDNQAEIMAHFE